LQGAEAFFSAPLRFLRENLLKKKITAIKAGRNPRVQRSNIYLDGKFAFSLDNEVLLKENLKVGLDLSPAEIDLLNSSDRFQRCLNAAFRFLSYRPRSEAETRERLQKHGYEEPEIEKVVAQLKRLSLLDDTAFAEFWKENRNSFRPRSQRLIKMELRRKGVEPGIIDETIEDMDETGNACKAAAHKARSLPVTDYEVFRKKLGAFLQRRGFSYGVISNAIKQAWLERTGHNSPEPDLSGEDLPQIICPRDFITFNKGE
jgi:regulatory protein